MCKKLMESFAILWQNIKMDWFRYAFDGHPRDKKREFSKKVFNYVNNLC